ncbi:hypothetical protein IC762_12165 [Bradyrhizobium genosp. L]|uniref:hypothetical protein n=1 Tax=Bradyrhizobium genosp. L TaxID=83637 RepID=UPI0018A3306A|nr:hypothetical protein [Bradyrhizobium genosp. L]QPF86999.1 hypothetical protein IC762_12165 [Bradyrhizobium genosp. L]
MIFEPITEQQIERLRLLQEQLYGGQWAQPVPAIVVTGSGSIVPSSAPVIPVPETEEQRNSRIWDAIVETSRS